MAQKAVQVTRRAVLWSAIMMAAAAGGAAACAPGQPEAQPAARTKEPLTLRLWGEQTEMGQMAAARLPLFEQKFAHVKVHMEAGNQLVLAVAGTLGDVSASGTNTGQHQYLARNGVFPSHEPFIARDRYDLKQFYDLGLQAVRIDGKLHGLLYKGQIARIALYYNVDLFERAGVRPPTAQWTYQDLAAAAVRLTQQSGGEVTQWGYAGNWRELTTLVASTRPWDGDVLSPDGKRATMNSPAVRASLQYHYDLALKQRAAALHGLGVNANELFYDGRAAMLGRVNLGIAGFIVPRSEGKYRWGMVRMPKLTPAGKRGGMWLPAGMSLTRETKHQDEAWELVKWLTDKEAGVALAYQTEGSSTPGGRPDVYADPRLLNRPGYPPGFGEEQRRAMEEPEPYVNPWNYSGSEANQVLVAELDKLTKGEAAVSEGFLNELNRQLQAILDKAPPTLQ
jgi:multiple sugar transport system substrate-binding protein